ncbi:hypothetical protein SK128_015498 [Halocaridina rubra]|uniref:Calpain catalytic domain-containing protein n=1 Tax=Halocaridina rubra TaxID=373956 RepID=A0AAN8XFY6_HALRR
MRRGLANPNHESGHIYSYSSNPYGITYTSSCHINIGGHCRAEQKQNDCHQVMKVVPHQRDKFQKFGKQASGLRPRAQVQDFNSIRQQCLDQRILFEDPDFPAADSSIYFSHSPPKPLEWKRPWGICHQDL